jgi:hypothetical protein
MRPSAPFAVPKVIGGRQLVVLIVKTDVSGEPTNGLQPLIALRYGGTLGRPRDRRFRPDVRLIPLRRKASKTAQEIFGI